VSLNPQRVSSYQSPIPNTVAHWSMTRHSSRPCQDPSACASRSPISEERESGAPHGHCAQRRAPPCVSVDGKVSVSFPLSADEASLDPPDLEPSSRSRFVPEPHVVVATPWISSCHPHPVATAAPWMRTIGSSQAALHHHGPDSSY
jgi:hypothetical protein